MATKDSKAKNVIIASDHITKEEQDLKETRTSDLGISMDKLNIGPKKKLLVLPIGGILCHKVHRYGPYTVPRNRRPDFSSGQFMSKYIHYHPLFHKGKHVHVKLLGCKRVESSLSITVLLKFELD